MVQNAKLIMPVFKTLLQCNSTLSSTILNFVDKVIFEFTLLQRMFA